MRRFPFERDNWFVCLWMSQCNWERPQHRNWQSIRRKGSIWPTQLWGNGLYSGYGAVPIDCQFRCWGLSQLRCDIFALVHTVGFSQCTSMDGTSKTVASNIPKEMYQMFVLIISIRFVLFRLLYFWFLKCLESVSVSVSVSISRWLQKVFCNHSLPGNGYGRPSVTICWGGGGVNEFGWLQKVFHNHSLAENGYGKPSVTIH